MAILTASLRNKLIPAALMALTLTGCYENFIPDIKTSPRLCLNSLIMAGSPVKVSVSRTWLYTDTAAQNNHSVADASLELFVNGQRADIDNYVACEGDRLRIIAASPTYGIAEAEVTVPQRPDIGNIKWEAIPQFVWHDSVPGWPMLCDIAFDLKAEIGVIDSSPGDDYFHVAYTGQYYSGNPDNDDLDGTLDPVTFTLGEFNYEAEPIFSEHIGVFESVTGSDAFGFTFFTDRQFSGGSYPLHLNFNNMYYTVRNQEVVDSLLDCKLVLHISSVSSSYYNWANYRWHNDDSPLGDLSEVGLGDPMWGYSNVSTGAGVVAASATRECVIDLHDFLESAVGGR